MFAKSADKKPAGRIDSLIGAGTEIDGGVRFSGGLRIDGVVKGEVLAMGDGPSMLVLSESGRIEGSVKVHSLVMNGTVVGPVRISGSLEMQPKARIVGDVEYAVIEMHQGAVIAGRLIHLEEGGNQSGEGQTNAVDRIDA